MHCTFGIDESETNVDGAEAMEALRVAHILEALLSQTGNVLLFVTRSVSLCSVDMQGELCLTLDERSHGC